MLDVIVAATRDLSAAGLDTPPRSAAVSAAGRAASAPPLSAGEDACVPAGEDAGAPIATSRV